MGGTHNKRSKAAAAKQKERKAQTHGARSTNHGGPSHYRSRHGYLSNFTAKKQNAFKSHSADIDPLDAQLFDYLIVVDVEATCQRDRNNFPHEIIEFPAILVDVRKGIVNKEQSFHSFIKPVLHPTLSPFCTELTGIHQETVDNAPLFSEAIENFNAWFRKTIPKGAKVVFCADGPWDFKHFFYEQHVLRDKQPLPTIFYEYIDIRTTFSHFFNNGVPCKLNKMLRQVDLSFVGREHCGMDDAYNIACLAVELMRRGCVLDFLVMIPLDGDEVHYSFDGYPIYRREEGSGHLDRDVVEDIAKHMFGEAYFAFGQKHAQEVIEYRKAHPRNFAIHKGVVMHQRTQRVRTKWRKKMFTWLLVLLALAMFLSVALYALFFRGR